MLLQIAREYATLPDLRTMRAHEIALFYDYLRPELKKNTRGRSDPTPKRHPKKPKRG
jgi:hypothetical protein